MKKLFSKSLTLLTLILILLPILSRATESSTDALKYLPVQDAGRIKPFDTFARESLQLVYGSQSYATVKDGSRRPAIEIVMTWMLLPQYWDEQEMLELNHRGLKESLKLPLEKKYFSVRELLANERLQLVMQELGAQREAKVKLSPYYQAVQRLESQLGTYQAIKEGIAIRPAPPEKTTPQTNDRWLAIAELKGDLQSKFALLTRAFIQALPKAAGDDKTVSGDVANDLTVPSLEKAVADFKAAARAQNPDLYGDERPIDIEVHYQTFHPFMWAWIFYLLTAILVGISWQTDSLKFYRAGWTTAAIAFALHTYGFVLRMYLTGRPPVSNMYESVVWVSWGCVLFSFIFEILNRRRFIVLAGSIVAVICLVLADLSPTILDGSIQQLEPVLRSNMWLSIHVLTITLSYSAFFLAWGLGNIGLVFILRGEKPTSERVRVFALSIYRAMQVGIVLLASGTILGGVWADYSWGRFWGWDPKETWAFIALMGYLALLHGRLSGWVQNFGTMAGAVISFNLVIMAWYGVNFVLGAGLHSYGFGAGGVQYVGSFVALDLIYVGYAWFVKTSRGRPIAPTPTASGS